MRKKSFSDFLAGLTSEFTPVVDAGFSVSGYTAIDLSVENENLHTAITGPGHLSHYIASFLKDAGKQVAWGGYMERRDLYQRSDLFSGETETDIRNIHLGIDIWAEAGTPVLSPLDAVVHSFQDNTAFGDYGPTIILQHCLEETIFHTLYGHLSRPTLDKLEVGQPIEKGQQIGWLGDPSENGNYAPHLHFQVMQDLMGKSGDFPGVASKSQLHQYHLNCPDPNLLLKMI